MAMVHDTSRDTLLGTSNRHEQVGLFGGCWGESCRRVRHWVDFRLASSFPNNFFLPICATDGLQANLFTIDVMDLAADADSVTSLASLELASFPTYLTDLRNDDEVIVGSEDGGTRWWRCAGARLFGFARVYKLPSHATLCQQSPT